MDDASRAGALKAFTPLEVENLRKRYFIRDVKRFVFWEKQNVSL